MADEDAPDAEATTEPAETPEPAAAPEPNAVHDELLARLRTGVGDDAVIESADALGGLVVRVANAQWQRVGEVAREKLECNYLSFIAGIDWAPTPREGTEEGGDTSAPV